MFPLLDGAKTFKNNLFLLRFATQNKPNVSSRFCFSVSKKVAKQAVVRNRMRRTGYQLLEKYIPEIKPNILAVFSFKTIPQNNEKIAENLESVLKESNLLK